MERLERFIIYPLLLFCLFYIIFHMTTISAGDGEIYLERIVADRIDVGLLVADDVTVKQELLAMESIVTLKEFVLLNERGTRIVVLSINAERGGSLELFNQEGGRATDLSTFQKSGLLMLYNNQGMTILRLGEDREAHGLIGVFNKNGKEPAFYGHQR